MKLNFFQSFLLTFFSASIIIFGVWYFIGDRFKPRDYASEVLSNSYQEIDMDIPVKAFLKRCASSNQLSYVRRLFVNQWISSNFHDLVKLIAYAQGALSYNELQKALDGGIEKEKSAKAAASFIQGAFKTINSDPKLIEHVNNSLKEGYDQSIHMLRGQLMGLDKESREYKKLKQEYRKQLEHWVDQKHGSLLDEIIGRL